MGAHLYLLQKWSLGAPKICYFWNNALELESRFLLRLTDAKSTGYIVKCFNQQLSHAYKNCIKLNFLQKTQWARVSTSRKSGAEGTKICHFWNNILKWKRRFTLGLKVNKSTDYIEQCFNQKLSKMKFPTKSLF